MKIYEFVCKMILIFEKCYFLAEKNSQIVVPIQSNFVFGNNSWSFPQENIWFFFVGYRTGRAAWRIRYNVIGNAHPTTMANK